jgi:hypothetical protein
VDNDNTKTGENASKNCENNNEMEVGTVQRNEVTSSNSNVTYDVVKKDKCSFESNENCSSSSEMQAKSVLPPPNSNGRYKKYNQRKMRHKGNNDAEKVKQFGKDAAVA